jgi:hypothetical protein
MKNGDLSNEVPPRILVTTDLFIKVTTTSYRKRLRTKKNKHMEINRGLLSRVYLLAQKVPYNLELVAFNLDDEELLKLGETLDKAGTNPFNFFTSYDSIDHLVHDLPYRPEVLAVIDDPTRLLRYGHWGRNLNEL